MHLTSEHHLADGTRERDLTLDGIPGVLWTPSSTRGPVPLVLLGHPGGLAGMRPRLAARAQRAAADGFASVTLELPGSGERAKLPALEDARLDLRRALAAGEPVDEVVERLVPPLVDLAVPEWRGLLDACLRLPGIDGPAAWSGGIIALGVRMALVEPRIVAAGLFAGSFVPRATYDEARQVTIPLHVLLQWDDEGNDRQAALDLFDAFGSADKSLHAHLGGHTGVPQHAGEGAASFFARHLRA